MSRPVALDEARKIAASDKQDGDGDEVTAERREGEKIGASIGAGDKVRRGEASLHGRLRARAARDCAGMALYGGRLGRDYVPPRALVRLSRSA